jgi:rare lipoprotein A
VLKSSQVVWVGLLACVLTMYCGERAEAREVLASWYGPGFRGLQTASGEPYDPSGYTAAHKRVPFGTELLVRYKGRSVQVTVNDRGPYFGQRKLDLSSGAAKYIGLKRVGVDYVDYTVVGRSYDDSYGSYDATYSETDSYTSRTTQAPDRTYIVQRGDSLSGIATQLGTTVRYLAAANGIDNPDIIYSGQRIFY